MTARVALSPPWHVFGDRRLTDRDPKLQQLPMDARRAPQRVRDRHLTNQRTVFAATVGRPPRRRLFHVQSNRKPRRCHASTVAGVTRTSAGRHPLQTRDNHAHSTRSAVGQAKALATRPVHDRQLMSQGENLKVEGRA